MAASSSNLKQLVLILIFQLKLTQILSNIEDYKNPWYSTKTPYFWLHDPEEEIQEDSEMWLDHDKSSCQAIHLNVVFRHGARFPGLKWIKRMSALHARFLKDGQIDKYPSLKSWTNPFPESSEKLLAELGEDEHFELGSRFGKKFSLLFEDENENIQYVVSSKQRTQASASAFHDGLTNSVSSSQDNQELKPKVDDIALRFHDNCDKFKVTVDKNDSAMLEYHKFKSGPEVAQVGSEMEQKLGIPISAGKPYISFTSVIGTST